MNEVTLNEVVNDSGVVLGMYRTDDGYLIWSHPAFVDHWVVWGPDKTATPASSLEAAKALIIQSRQQTN